ncbi:MAG: discoidin domain-containing protein [Firmicutes bacterium]|nr:discoidin domain-containing protein [Bacillota bacterium]
MYKTKGHKKLKKVFVNFFIICYIVGLLGTNSKGFYAKAEKENPQQYTPINYAYGKTAVDEKNRPSVPNINDGNYETYFEALKADVNSWIYIDLGEVKAVDNVKIYTRQGAQKYYIQYAGGLSAPDADSADWITIVNNEDCKSSSMHSHTFNAVPARYIRYYCYEKTVNKSVSIFEIEVYLEKQENKNGIVSSKYDIDYDADLISNIPKNDATVASFKSNIVPLPGSVFEIYSSDGQPLTSENIYTGCRVIVTSEGLPSKEYTLKVGLPPTVLSLQLTGNPVIGSDIICDYEFFDGDGDAEAATIVMWYSSVSPNALWPLNWELISEGSDKKYTVTDSDDGKYIKCVVIPVSDGENEPIGDKVISDVLMSIGNLAWGKPTATEGGTTAGALVDGNYNSVWLNDLSNNDTWISLDLLKKMHFDTIVLRPANINDSASYAFSYVANKGGNWVPIAADESTVYQHGSSFLMYSFDPVFGSGVRLDITGTGSQSGIVQLEIYLKNKELEEIVNLASDASVMVSSGENTANYAIDGDLLTEWTPEPSDNKPWLKLDLGKAMHINKVVIIPTNNLLKGYQIAGSNNEESWITLFESEGILTSENGSTAFAEANIRYLRFTATDSAGGEIGIKEMEVYYDKTQKAADYLEIEKDARLISFKYYITADFILPTVGESGSAIKWSSGNEENIKVLDGVAKVSRPDRKDAYVTLTATFTKRDAVVTYKYNVIVPMIENAGNSGGTTKNITSAVKYPLDTGAVDIQKGEDEPTNNEGQKTESFIDLDSAGWAREYIEGLVKENILAGVGNGRFEPNRFINREEFVKILVLSFGSLKRDIPIEFKDVQKGEWYYDYVSTAYSMGIVKGNENNLFGVGKHITRQDMATMAYRAFKGAGNLFEGAEQPMTFDDMDDISDYAKEAIINLQQSGIIIGGENHLFLPHDFSTRAQAAKIVYLLKHRD